MTIFRRKTKTPLSPAPLILNDIMIKKVLLLIDWDNLFISLYRAFGADKMCLSHRLKKLVEWVKNDIGELCGGHGFVFAPEHLSALYQQMCVENGLRLITCPKRKLAEPKRNVKTGRMVSEEDTVDETIIWFCTLMMRHPDIKYICLVAGDDDYVQMFKEAARFNVKRALAPPTLESLAKTKKLVGLVDKHPITHKKMVLRVDEL